MSCGPDYRGHEGHAGPVCDVDAEIARLKAENARLRKAGERMACHLVCSDLPNDVCDDLMKNWNAAKEVQS